MTVQSTGPETLHTDLAGTRIARLICECDHGEIMPSLLSSAALAQASPNQHLLLLQSSTAQTCLPVLRAIVTQAIQSTHETTILFCFLYRPPSILDPSRGISDVPLVVDKTAVVPGYDDVPVSEQDRNLALKEELLEAIRSGELIDRLASSSSECSRVIRTAPSGPLSVVIDSVDTLLSDVGSLSVTIRLLSEMFALVRERGGKSFIILVLIFPCPRTLISCSAPYLQARPA